MSQRRYSRWPWLVTVVLAMSACTGPKVRPPQLDTELPARWRAEGETRAHAQANPISWWSGEAPAELVSFIGELLEHNHDLRAAAARVARAEAEAVLAGANLSPQVGVGLDASRRRSNFIGLPIPGRENDVLQSFSTSYGLSLDLSWELDLWGRIRAGQMAAIADFEAAQSEREAATLSLAAQGARLWFAAAEAQLQLALARETVASLTRTTSLIEARYLRGLRPASDLRLASSNLADARAEMSLRHDQLDRTRRQLEILAGRYPSATLDTDDDFPALPSVPPTGIPADLITRRPDLIAAERRVAAAGGRAEAARAELYPKIRLSASGGTATEQIQDLVDLDLLVWSIVGGLAQPLIDGGSIRAGIDRAEALRIEASEAYVSAALQAFREVEDALSRDLRLAEQQLALEQSATHATAAHEISENRYATGLGSVLFVLEAERRARSARRALLTVRRARLDNRIDLHLALGGSLVRPTSMPEDSQP